MARVIAVGAAMLDRLYDVSHLPEPDGNAFAPDPSTALGGVAANVATGAARLDHDVGLIARLGADEAAQRVLAALDDRGIDTERIQLAEDPEERSTHSLVFRADDGERMVVTVGESVRRLRLEPPDLSYCRAADAVSVNAYLPDPAARRLREALPDGFPPVVYDLPGPVSELRARGTEPATLDRLLPYIDVFVTNAGAARSYLGSETDFVRALRDRECTRGAITHGADGATLFTPDRTVDVPAFDVDAVDTTGAGDAFVAGLLHAWVIEDRTVAAAGRFAAATAALNCTASGAQGGLPTADRVERFLARRG